MQVEIIGINNNGDGFGLLNNKKVFINKTAVGDIVEFTIMKENKDFIMGKLKNIVKRSIDVIDNILCPYYNECGGCNLLHLKEDVYYNYKKNIIDKAIEKSGYDYKDDLKLIKVGENSRRRVVFQVKNNKLGFFEKNTNNLKEIDNCLLITSKINKIIQDLKLLIKKIQILEISITSYDNGLEVLLTVKKDIDLSQNKILKDFIESNSNIILLSYRVNDDNYFLFYLKTNPKLNLSNNITLESRPNIFLQATSDGQRAITDIVVNNLKNCKNVLDLYCGIGTYTFPLSEYTKVHSVEGLQPMIDILNLNIKENKLIGKITSECRNLVSSPLLKQELEKFDGIVINPPRNGAKAQCEIIAKSNVQKIVMVSCNPQTFSIDANELRLGGYKMIDIIGIDQFYRTQHLEVVGIFEKGV